MITIPAGERIGALFAIERPINGKPPDERQLARQDRARPLLDDLAVFLDAALAKISGKSELAAAIRYARLRWAALSRYLDDGRLDMSNNAAERAIRPLTLGRKNWTFAGADAGGDRAAAIYTLVETAKLNGLDPEAYLRNVIARIADQPINRITELLPWNFGASACNRPPPDRRPQVGEPAVLRGRLRSPLPSLEAAACVGGGGA